MKTVFIKHFVKNIFQNETEVKCIQCLTSICAFCFLKSHNKHDLKILGELETDIKTNLNEKLHDLKYDQINYGTLYIYIYTYIP